MNLCRKIAETKKRKYNKSELQFTAKSERYTANNFKKNKIEEQKELDEKRYKYYVRPWIPLWRVQQLNFDAINSFNEIPSQNEGA